MTLLTRVFSLTMPAASLISQDLILPVLVEIQCTPYACCPATLSAGFTADYSLHRWRQDSSVRAQYPCDLTCPLSNPPGQYRRDGRPLFRREHQFLPMQVR